MRDLAAARRASRSTPGPLRQRAADRDVERRRSGDAGADRRLARACAASRPRAWKKCSSQPSSRSSAVQRELAPVGRLDARPVSTEPITMRSSSRDSIAHARPQADRDVERLRAVVEEVERPDVDRAAGQVDARRSGGVDAHAAIIGMAIARMRCACASRSDVAHRSASWPSSASPGTSLPPEIALARPRVRPGRRHPVHAQRRVARAGGRASRVEAQQLARELPLWVSVDQEGGRVARLRQPFTEWPPMATLGRAGDEALARRFAAALALELTAVGISLDFAPVLDVLTNPKNPVIGDRALGERRRDVVARLGAAIIAGAAGRAASPPAASTSPGTATRAVDSHLELPLVEHPPDRLRGGGVRAVPRGHRGRRRGHHDGAPARAVARRAAAGHAVAARSSTGVLRGELGFDGLVFTDDLDMKAIAGRTDAGPGGRRGASRPGCDVALLCGTDVQPHAAALEALIHAVEQRGAALEARRGRARAPARGRRSASPRRAARRSSAPIVAPLAATGGRSRPCAARLVGCDEHQAVAAEMQAIRVTMRKPRASRAGRPRRRRRARQPVPRGRVRRRAGRAARGSASSRSTTTTRLRPATATWPATAETRAGARSRRACATRRSPRSWPPAAATAACRCCRCSTRAASRRRAQADRRLQRPHVAADVRHRPRAASSAFHGPTRRRPARARRGGVRRGVASSARSPARAPLGELRRPALEVLRAGEARGPLFGGNLTQLAASLGTPFAFDPPRGLRAVPRGRERAAVPPRPAADAAAAGRHPRPRGRGIVFGDFPGCDEPGGQVDGARRARATARARFPGPGAVRLSVGPHAAARADAAARRRGARRRVRAARAARSVIEEDRPRSR